TRFFHTGRHFLTFAQAIANHYGNLFHLLLLTGCLSPLRSAPTAARPLLWEGCQTPPRFHGQVTLNLLRSRQTGWHRPPAVVRRLSNGAPWHGRARSASVPVPRWG